MYESILALLSTKSLNLLVILRWVVPLQFPKKCVRCAEAHNPKDCDQLLEEPPTSVNCGGDHAANWKDCPRIPGSEKNQASAPINNRVNSQEALKPRPLGASLVSAHSFEVEDLILYEKRKVPKIIFTRCLELHKPDGVYDLKLWTSKGSRLPRR
ncbi:hypothetical protein CEXT_83141 [Caerostris extrusa]|uniref:Uncharacterized protein n=1 Tax=Caerostris extrusa TaxID=172846 RepID=A0AAV4SBA1_CAEEX|nr:hypothetical protein CEXT_83141 [Caerostris extrusa]